MLTIDSCQLTTKDYTILEVMQEGHPRGDPFSAILQRKISSAVVMFREDIPATVVTLSTRVAYRVNDGPAETRIVAHDEMRGLVGMLLPITNPRGLALLGLAEGQSMSIPTTDGGLETLTVQEVGLSARSRKAREIEAGRGCRAGLVATGPTSSARCPSFRRAARQSGEQSHGGFRHRVRRPGSVGRLRARLFRRL